jgi:hypothetical protein
MKLQSAGSANLVRKITPVRQSQSIAKQVMATNLPKIVTM